jgi:anti-sigma regulatory factor (Ser/Thr protein kinase)
VPRLEVRLTDGLEAAAEARRAVQRLAAHLQPDVLEDVRFLVNELVTNGVKYGRGSILLQVEVDAQAIRVEVSDDGGGFLPRVQVPDLEKTSGRGLFLVERIADRWGVTGADQTNVWFEIDCARQR